MRQWQRCLCSAAGLAALLADPAFARQKGEGSVRLEYQYIRTGAFDSSIGEIDIGNTDGHALLFSADYTITNRWTLTASLPWIKKRHQGALPHDPVNDFTAYTPPDLRLIDDGSYHSDWQDLYVGANYLAKEGPLTIEPFIAVGVPTNNYPFYGHAAVGRNLWHVPVGAGFSYQPYFSDFFFAWNVAYVFTEKTLGVDVSHWLVHAEASYFVTPRFVPKVFVSIKHGTEGLGFPDDYDLADLDNERWYKHDLMIKHNFTNAGVGVDWVLSDKYQLSMSWFTMVGPDQVNVVDRAWTVGLTYNFSAGRN